MPLARCAPRLTSASVLIRIIGAIARFGGPRCGVFARRALRVLAPAVTAIARVGG
jgi:hypothetical protein